MAESEFSVLSRQCLNRTIPDRVTLSKKHKARVKERNGRSTVTDGQFTTDDARIKLKSWYPNSK